MMIKKILCLIGVFGGLVMAQTPGYNTAVLQTPPPAPVQQVFVTQAGVAGAVRYCYYVVAMFNIGMTQASGAQCINSANSTLDSSNYNTITWNPPPNTTPIGYWVIRNTSNVFPGSGTTAVNATVISGSTTTYNDQSNTLNSFTYNPSPVANGQWQINNQNYQYPVIQYATPDGNVDFQFYGIPVLPPTTSSYGMLWSAEGNATVAQLNSKVHVLPAILGRQYKVVGFLFNPVGGQPATCTTINLQVTDTNPVISVPVATLTASSWINETGANITFTNFMVPIAKDQGVDLTQAGSTCTTMTSLNYRIFYRFL